MDRLNSLSDFLTEDFAYFLGLVVGRGTLSGAEHVTLIIDFPYKNLIIEPSKSGSHNVYHSLSNSLDIIVERIRKIGLEPRKLNDSTNQVVSIKVEWQKGDITGQLITYLLNGEHKSYHDFRVPRAVFEADNEKKREFLRGFFDVTGHIRPSNRDQSNQHRIYLEVDQKNWWITLDLYDLCDSLNVRVQNINYGHPNLRDPQGGGGWPKEHQFRVYANQFLPVGSYITHKQAMLDSLATINRKGVGARSRGPRIVIKPSHPDEQSSRLPWVLRGQHFDHYTQLMAFLRQHDPEKAWRNNAE